MSTNTMSPQSLCEAFQSTAARNLDSVAFRTPGGAVSITWREYRDRVQRIASGLAKLGVEPGATVALMLTNRPEFHLVDTAVLHAAATPFSIYNTNPPEMVKYLFGNAGNRVVVCEQQFLPVIRAAIELGATVDHVVCVDGAVPGAIGLDEVESSPSESFDFERSWRSVKPQDLLTIVYTSGTTGPPKGVELTHANFIANAQLMSEFGGVDSTDRIISYLPDAHAANRWVAHYCSLLFGPQITCVADPKKVIDALTDVRPTFFLGVPRIWVKIKAALEAKLADEPSPIKRALANWAIATGKTRARAASDGRPLGLVNLVQYELANQLVLSKIRAKLGMDEVRVAVSGAAPIPAEVHEFMLALGIRLCEGWGMSECTAAVTMNRPARIRIGTVGTPVPGAEIKLADDGEVLVRGPMVMRGYRHAPEKTAEAIDAAGWLRTGDIGVLDGEGNLSIVDRKKELIINAAGKNMSPANIENTIISNCPLASTVAVIGDARPYVTALICLDPDAMASFATRHRLGTDSIPTLAANPAVIQQVQKGIDNANSKLSRVEQIKKFTILPETWEPGSAYLTPTGKLKRKPISVGFERTINAMYAVDRASSK